MSTTDSAPFDSDPTHWCVCGKRTDTLGCKCTKPEHPLRVWSAGLPGLVTMERDIIGSILGHRWQLLTRYADRESELCVSTVDLGDAEATMRGQRYETLPSDDTGWRDDLLYRHDTKEQATAHHNERALSFAIEYERKQAEAREAVGDALAWTS